MNFRKYKYSPIFSIRGEYAANGSMDESDIVGSIKNCIATNVGKLTPQMIRVDSKGMQIKDDYLARLLSLRWSPECSTYDALYKMAAQLVSHSNAFSVVMYTDDFTRIKSILPVTVRNYRIYEDDNGVLLFRFVWDYDGKTYTIPYQFVIHIKARFDRKRFLGTPPEGALKNTLELIDTTGEGLRNIVKNSANLKGYLKYNNFIDDDELKEKVREFQKAYMDASNEGGLAGLDNSTEFHEISQKAPTIPALQTQFLRENVYRYYNANENILMSKFSEAEWNAFYESVIEPIALQLSLEFTYKILTERERGFGNKIVFTSNRLQYATLQTRATIGSIVYDRGVISINEFRELLYYEPIEGGDVRMVSLNYVKADDQSLYQTGQQGNEPAKEDPQQAARVPPDYFLNRAYVEMKLKGGARN